MGCSGQLASDAIAECVLAANTAARNSDASIAVMTVAPPVTVD